MEKQSRLINNFEQMLADAENNGRAEYLQPLITPDDAELILNALRNYTEYLEASERLKTGDITIADKERLACYLKHVTVDSEKKGGIGIQPRITIKDAMAIISALNRDTYSPSADCIDPRSRKPLPFMQRELADTAAGMTSHDYKERFRAEYIQTKIRYERLKAFNTKIEAAFRTECERPEVKKALMPPHDCPHDLLREQQEAMGHYLHILEVRAVIEGVDLGGC